MVRMDSAFYGPQVIAACRGHEARFSVTAKTGSQGQGRDRSNRRGRVDTDRLSARHLRPQASGWVSDAEVAETRYIAFTSRKGQAVTARLIVRRVKRLNEQAGRGQDELFASWRYYPTFTDSPYAMLQAEEQHRDHAVPEQVNADLIDGPLAHMPSGSFAANAAWLTLAALTHNLLRATGCLASAFHAKARGATLRRQLIAVPARIARHGRGQVIFHLPEHWSWQQAWTNAFTATCHPPPAHAA
ncbi:transposase [Nonomuraea candida]|uniref:transposase n=1 Tax=Nonomuraea candida TaxID=359159 RepID=UPI003F6E11BF